MASSVNKRQRRESISPLPFSTLAPAPASCLLLLRLPPASCFLKSHAAGHETHH